MKRTWSALLLAMASQAASVASAQTAKAEEVTQFKNSAGLAEALIQPGRCPKGKTAHYMEACAVIRYVALNDDRDTVYRPVFKVERNASGYKAWTINQSELKELRLSEIHNDIRTQAPDGRMTHYMPVSVLGNSENKENCLHGRDPCLRSASPRNDVFQQYRFQLRPTEADKVWMR